MKIWQRFIEWFGRQRYQPVIPEKRIKHEKRICVRCLGPIHRNQHWSRVMWDDRKPRHKNVCDCQVDRDCREYDGIGKIV